MSGDPTYFGEALDVTSTTALRPLGSVRVEHNATYGRRVWLYVRADAAGAFVAGNSVKRKASTNGYVGIVGTAGSSRPSALGCAQHAIPASSYGWILKEGFGTVLDSGAGLTANTGVTFAAAGTWADGVVGTNDLMAYTGALVAAGATGIALIRC